MSRENELPIDPGNEPASAHDFERLSQIERHLKRTRPRPVEMNGLEVERMAFATPRQSKPERRPSRLRRYRTATVVASSWTCGVLVGALAMFLTLSHGRDEPVMTRHPQNATSLQSGKKVIDPAESPSSDRKWSESEAAVLALVLPQDSAADRWGRLRLRAGIDLPGLLRNEDTVLGSTGNVPADLQGDTSPSRDTSAADPIVPPPTREQLMRDLLKGPSSRVL